jgi:hypothetical protein
MSLYKLWIQISELSNQWCSFYAAANPRTCIIIFISTVYTETDALVNNHAIEGSQTFDELLCDTMS